VLRFRGNTGENKLVNNALVNDFSGPVMVLVEEHNVFRNSLLEHDHYIVECAHRVSLSQVASDLPEVVLKFPVAEVVFAEF
jgi:hypothetical protein